MMDGLRLLLLGIDPGLEHFENEQAVRVHQARIGHFAFEIGEAFLDQRRRYALGGQGRQAERLEFVEVAARRIADLHHFGRQLARRVSRSRIPWSRATRQNCD